MAQATISIHDLYSFMHVKGPELEDDAFIEYEHDCSVAEARMAAI